LWNFVESDFQREYNIDLTTSTFSWRRFLALFSGLSKDSAFFSIYNYRSQNKPIEGVDNIARDIALSISGNRK
jgi:hypothetical protein